MSVCLEQRTNGAACDLGFEDGGAALALENLLARKVAAAQVVGLADLVRQPAVHQRITAVAKFLAPGSVFDLVLQYFFQAGAREVIAPIWHTLSIVRSREKE